MHIRIQIQIKDINTNKGVGLSNNLLENTLWGKVIQVKWKNTLEKSHANGNTQWRKVIQVETHSREKDRGRGQRQRQVARGWGSPTLCLHCTYWGLLQVPGKGDTKNGSCWWPSVGCYGNERSAMQCHGSAQFFKAQIFQRVFIPVLRNFPDYFLFWNLDLHIAIPTQCSSVRGKYDIVTISRIWKASITYLSSSLDCACKITRVQKQCAVVHI